MNAKAITTAGDLHHFVKAFEIVPRADGHTFFLGEANVIATLLFHASQDFILRAANVHDDGARRLDVVLRKTESDDSSCREPKSGHFGLPGVWFDF